MDLAMPPITQEQLLQNTDKVITIKYSNKNNIKWYNLFSVMDITVHPSNKAYFCTIGTTVLTYKHMSQQR
jgi:hypothetical protein